MGKATTGRPDQGVQVQISVQELEKEQKSAKAPVPALRSRASASREARKISSAVTPYDTIKIVPDSNGSPHISIQASKPQRKASPITINSSIGKHPFDHQFSGQVGHCWAFPIFIPFDEIATTRPELKFVPGLFETTLAVVTALRQLLIPQQRVKFMPNQEVGQENRYA